MLHPSNRIIACTGLDGHTRGPRHTSYPHLQSSVPRSHRVEYSTSGIPDHRRRLQSIRSNTLLFTLAPPTVLRAVLHTPSRPDPNTPRSTTSATPIFKPSDLPVQRLTLVATNKTLRALSTFNVHEMIMSLAVAKAAFMSSPHFAVLGASKDRHKVGTKVRLVVLGVDYMRFLSVVSW